MKNIAVILAGGKGKRFGNYIPKQFTKLAGKPIIQYTLEIFNQHKLIDEIIVVINKKYKNKLKEIINKIKLNKKVFIIEGGSTRQESSYNAINFLSKNNKVNKNDNILFHDAVRPFVSLEIITEVINYLQKYNAIDVAIPVTDTLIKVNNNIIIDIPERSNFMRGQTPQGFKFRIIKEAHEKARNENFNKVTDDCGLVLKYFPNEKIYVVRGEEKNIKITYPIDIFIANYLIQLGNKLKFSKPNLNFFKGKTVIIFGSSSGIGKEIFNILNNIKECKVYGFSRSNGVDITDKNRISKIFSSIYKNNGKIDIIINTAGILYKGKLESLSYDKINEQIKTNYFGSIIIAKEAIPYLKQTSGHLILFGSSSYSRGRAEYTIYSSTKAALVNFIQGLSEELSEYNIKVNIISPERTLTPMRIKNFGNEPKKSLLDAKDVAKITLKVIESGITGQNIEIRVDEFN